MKIFLFLLLSAFAPGVSINSLIFEIMPPPYRALGVITVNYFNVNNLSSFSAVRGGEGARYHFLRALQGEVLPHSEIIVCVPEMILFHASKCAYSVVVRVRDK